MKPTNWGCVIRVPAEQRPAVLELFAAIAGVAACRGNMPDSILVEPHRQLDDDAHARARLIALQVERVFDPRAIDESDPISAEERRL